ATVNGGTQNINSGGTVTSATVNAGVQTIASGAEVTSATVKGGTQILSSGVSIDGDQTVLRGAVASGGTITSTTSKHTQHVYGTAQGATINNGGVQHVYGGGYATGTTINDGGTLMVDDNGTAQVAQINGNDALVKLLDLGGATVIFGDGVNTVPNLYARGDNVRLRTAGDTAVGRTLTVTNLDGYADFYVNTDLANNTADKVVITNAANADKANTIRINYDKTLAAKGTVAATNTQVATAPDGVTFVGGKSTIGGLSYLPTVTQDADTATQWNITGVESLGASDASHHTLMGMTAATAALAAGNAFIGEATKGLSMASNVGADGIATFAKLGGGSVRQETGSHVDVRTWNAILALGHKNEQAKSTFEYGAFFEYGSGNYTTHEENTLRGDGSLRYTGGGLLAKWTNDHGLYVEGSFRAGSVRDDASNVLHDDANTYSYKTNAGYIGAHIGVGKEFTLVDGNTLDVYGKYYHSRRNGVSFNAGGNAYDLDAVTSRVLSVGARYTMKREKWNFYGGLAYEYEFGGLATGTVDGNAIRSADVGGGSFRAEIGATMQPDKDSPWQLDLNLAGFAGKKEGFSGGVSVAFLF
ncbi:MAG: AIDA repeat-containing protein, partial [Schwartzia sp.]|nr:AIDA repeat-containing protein [Schwartzia sp. (in: firmicutes)]